MEGQEDKEAARTLLQRCLDDTHCTIRKEIKKLKKKKQDMFKIGSTGDFNPEPSQK